MDHDELIKLLDLGGQASRDGEESVVLSLGEGQTDAPGGPTALELDGWAMRRGRDLLASSRRLQGMGLDADAAADFHGCAFEPDPRLAETCADRRRRGFVEALLGTPDYRALHSMTRLDEAASEIAAVAFAEQFSSLKGRRAEASPAVGIGPEVETLRAVGKAVGRATEEVAELQEAAAAFGLGPGSPGSNDAQAIAGLFRRVRNSPALRRICALAGRFRRVAQSRQRQKTSHGLDDLVGVTLGGDLERLLPSELARLALPELELDALRRLVERQCLCRDHRAPEPAALGPVLVSVDESGSMQGGKVEAAKALALALAWVARQQRRWCGLVAYSGSTGERLLALPPTRWDEAALAGWLEGFLGHGSSLDVPVAELPDYYRRLGCPHGVTDVVLVTDALCVVPPALKERFLGWKREAQARVISLVLNRDAGDLAGLSDEVHLVESLAPEGEAAGRALSL